jgi:hypothetical protein
MEEAGRFFSGPNNPKKQLTCLLLYPPMIMSKLFAGFHKCSMSFGFDF